MLSPYHRLSSGMFSRTRRRKPVRLRLNERFLCQVIAVTRFSTAYQEWVL